MLESKYILHTYGTVNLQVAILAMARWQKEIARADRTLTFEYEVLQHDNTERTLVIKVTPNEKSLRVNLYYKDQEAEAERWEQMRIDSI